MDVSVLQGGVRVEKGVTCALTVALFKLWEVNDQDAAWHMLECAGWIEIAAWTKAKQNPPQTECCVQSHPVAVSSSSDFPCSS